MTINWGEVKQSLKDLTMVHKVKESNAKSFVTWYEKKYRIPRGHFEEMLAIVLNEIKVLDSQKV
jgi:hypothetical protein